MHGNGAAVDPGDNEEVFDETLQTGRLPAGRLEELL